MPNATEKLKEEGDKGRRKMDQNTEVGRRVLIPTFTIYTVWIDNVWRVSMQQSLYSREGRCIYIVNTDNVLKVFKESALTNRDRCRASHEQTIPTNDTERRSETEE